MRRRREFYKENPESEPCDPEENGKTTNRRYSVFSSKDKINVSLTLQGPPPMFGKYEQSPDKNRPRRYFLCPALVTVAHLKHLLKSKYGSPNEKDLRVDIFWKNAQLPDQYTLLDIGYSYPWNRSRPMDLSYRVVNAELSSMLDAAADHRLLSRWEEKRKRKCRSASSGASEAGCKPVGRRKKKRRRRDCSGSSIGGRSSRSAPEAIEEIAEVEGEESPTELDNGGKTVEEKVVEDPCPLLDGKKDPLVEDDAKENLNRTKANVPDIESQPSTETKQQSPPRTNDVPVCDIRSSVDWAPSAKASVSTPSPELPTLRNIPVHKPDVKPCEKRRDVVRSRPPSPKTPELRKRKRCLTPVVHNGVAEREELRSSNGECSSNDLLPASPLYPWNVNAWTQYYRHLHMNSPSLVPPSPSFLSPPMSSPTLHGPGPGAASHVPPLPSPSASPFNSPLANFNYSSAVSSTVMWGSSTSSVDFRQYHHHQHLHHHHYTPPVPQPTMANSLLSPRHWDAVDYRSIFDFSTSRWKYGSSGYPNGSSSPLPSPLGASSGSPFGTSALSPPIPPFPPFRPASTPPFYSSMIPLSPCLDRELPKH